MSRKFITLALVTLAMGGLSATALAQVGQSYSPAKLVKPAQFARSMPLRDMRYPNLPPLLRRLIGDRTLSEGQIAQLRDKLVKGGLLRAAGAHVVVPLYRKKSALSKLLRVRDPALQTSMPRAPKIFTAPGLGFDGLGQSTGTSTGFTPPDTNAAVGENYIVETVNTEFGVYNKSDGSAAMPATNIANLWTSMGGPCLNDGTSDPIVNYDQFDRRWVISQITVSGSPNYQCIAVSQTDDPTGAYYLYAYPLSNGIPDYPKVAVWPNAYYATYNDFNPGFDGVIFVAYDRDALIKGDPNAPAVKFLTDPNTQIAYSDLPVEVDGEEMPPAGSPGLFINYFSPNLWGTSGYGLELWAMRVDWANTGNSTLTDVGSLTVDPFTDLLCGGSGACVPQENSTTLLDPLSDRLMYRAVYRNFGTHQAIAAMQNVGADTSGNPPVGERWYELRAPAASTSPSAWSVYQQGTFAPSGTDSRWMGSIAFDHSGDMAMGYSVSGPSQDPEIAYTGRLASDPLGQMTQPETVLQAAGGADTGPYDRWGDYTSMQIDPSDDCTFWYANQYWASTGDSSSWSTHIGSMKFNNCTPIPEGTLTGTVTDAGSGAPIANATVTITQSGIVITILTDNTGNYSIQLAPGNYTVTASDFGYGDSSSPVVITQGQTTTQNFALTAAPTSVLSGKVTDGSGHGYGLYAEIKITTPGFGQVADISTDPTTGAYSVKLPTGDVYTMDVQAVAFDGYNPATATVTLNSDMTQNFALTVADTCSAPGYTFVPGFGQDFNGSFPPTGWTVTNAVTGAVYWQLNSAYASGNGNYTGGTGTAADADSNEWGPAAGSFDTSLITPPLPVTSLPGHPILGYRANYQEYSGNEALDLDISSDGGTTWTTISHWTTSHPSGSIYSLPGENVLVPLAPYLPASGSFELRWRYYNPVGDFDWYAQIDDVSIGTCQPVSGGLFYGQVTDANNSQGLVGATVSDDKGDKAITHTNPADPNLPVGVYLMFSPPGNRTLTASDNDYQDATASATMTDNAVVMQNFALKAGHLAANPDHFTMNITVNTTATAAFALSNVGDIGATFHILPINLPPPAGLLVIAKGKGAPLHEVHGHFIPQSVIWMQNHKGAKAPAVRQPASFTPKVAPWMSIANYPEPIMDNCAAASAAGSVYSFDGYNGNANVDDVYMYDPTSDTWSQMAGNPTAVEAPACAYINGKFYLADGWDATTGAVTAALQIYDPVSNSWSTGTDNPSPLGGGVVAVALDGKMYLIGGCDASNCGYKTVEIYDPTTDSWSTAADYPHTVSFESCGVIDSKIYCAGGTAGNSEYADGYAYDPTSNSWSPIASIPVASGGLWGSGYVAALGELVVSGGVTNDFSTITNQTFAYDPTNNTWSSLANSNDALARGGSACGFYLIGGFDTSLAPLPNSEQLPGYTPCGKQPSIPWATVSPLNGTVAAGASANVGITFNGTGQTEFTTSRAYLAVTNNTPYGAPIVPLTVNWVAKHVNMAMTGVASPNPVQKGGNLSYGLTVANQQGSNLGAATEATVSYPLPAGVSYVASTGDASCTAPPSGSSSAPSPGTVTCAFGTIDLGTSKSETIVVNVANAGTLTSHFMLATREPNDGQSELDVTSTVTGTADLSASSSNTTIPISASGEIHMAASNAGPDTATNVVFKVTSGEDVKLIAGQWSMNAGGVSVTGDCLLDSGVNGLDCDLPDMPSGATADIVLDGFGAYAGTATVVGQVTTSANDPNPGNNVTTATVTVKSSGGGGGSSGGGGALGWLALAALLGLGLAGAGTRRRRT